MISNPFDDQLESHKDKLQQLDFEKNKITQEILWFDRTTLEELISDHEKLNLKLKNHVENCNRQEHEIVEMTKNIHKLSQSINTLWNPLNWFDSDQSELRNRERKQSSLLASRKNTHTKSQETLKQIENSKQSKIEEIGKYKTFDIKASHSSLTAIELKLSHQREQLNFITLKKQQLDKSLSPIISEIRSIEQKKTKVNSDIEQAQRLDKQLSNADNSYERAMIHEKNEELFGVGSPKKVISRNDSEIRRLERNLTKLKNRANVLIDKSARNIKKLIIDGNNLCYDGGTFIGFNVLKALIPILIDSHYDITIIFDASIRRLSDSGDSKIRELFGEKVKIHIVSTSVKADETVLDLAENDETTFIISNDRFAEFNEKSAVRDKRVIRHEIISGKIFIHDLGVLNEY